MHDVVYVEAVNNRCGLRSGCTKAIVLRGELGYSNAEMS